MSEETTLYADPSIPAERRLLSEALLGCTGPHRFRFKPCRPTRSTKQNALYWVAYVQPVASFLRQHGQNITPAEVHFGWRMEFLKHTTTHPVTGEVLFETPRSTTILNCEEFSEYLEFVEQWMWDKLGMRPSQRIELEGAHA